MLLAAVGGFLAAFAYPTLHGESAYHRRLALPLLPQGWTAEPQVIRANIINQHGKDSIILDVQSQTSATPLDADDIVALARRDGWTIVDDGPFPNSTPGTGVVVSKPYASVELDVMPATVAKPTSLFVEVTTYPRGRVQRSLLGALVALTLAGVALLASRGVLGAVNPYVAAACLGGVLVAGLTTWVTLFASHVETLDGRLGLPLPDPGPVRLAIGAVSGLASSLAIALSQVHRRRHP